MCAYQNLFVFSSSQWYAKYSIRNHFHMIFFLHRWACFNERLPLSDFLKPAKAKHVISCYDFNSSILKWLHLLVSVFVCVCFFFWHPSAADSRSAAMVTSLEQLCTASCLQSLLYLCFPVSSCPAHSHLCSYSCRCGRMCYQHPQLSPEWALCEHGGFICMWAAGPMSCRLSAEEQCLRGWVHCSWCISLRQFTQQSFSG